MRSDLSRAPIGATQGYEAGRPFVLLVAILRQIEFRKDGPARFLRFLRLFAANNSVSPGFVPSVPSVAKPVWIIS
jgi:hypothetical protein